MSSESVKVCDVELRKLADLAECWDEVSGVLGKYVAIMEKVQKDAVKKGEIHTALENLYYFSERFYNFSLGHGAVVAGKARGLANKIEEIDINLYNEV